MTDRNVSGDRSRVLIAIRRSRVVGGGSYIGRRLGIHSERTAVAPRTGTNDASKTPGAKVVRNSRLITMGNSVLGRWSRLTLSLARNSVLFSWLASEPEPVVLKVDLEDSMLIGSLIGLVEELARSMRPATPDAIIVNSAAEINRELKHSTIRAISVVVLVAVLANLTIRLFSGSLSRAELGGRVILLLLAVIGAIIGKQREEPDA